MCADCPKIFSLFETVLQELQSTNEKIASFKVYRLNLQLNYVPELEIHGVPMVMSWNKNGEPQ